MKIIKRNERNRVEKLEELIYFNIKNHYKQEKDIALVFIGTDKCTGDSLGPLIGTKIEKREEMKDEISIYGTLENPIHPMKLEGIFEKIDEANSLIIVVDAVLGESTSVGDILIDTGSIFPGITVCKKLVQKGDISISAVVGEISEGVDLEVLFDARLSVVYALAEEIESSLSNVIKKMELEKALLV